MSPPDRIGKVFSKCEENHKWGVRYCWVIDPERKAAWEYTPDDIEPRRMTDALTAGPLRSRSMKSSSMFKSSTNR
jgi:hypothetical protein